MQTPVAALPVVDTTNLRATTPPAPEDRKEKEGFQSLLAVGLQDVGVSKDRETLDTARDLFKKEKSTPVAAAVDAPTPKTPDARQARSEEKVSERPERAKSREDSDAPKPRAREDENVERPAAPKREKVAARREKTEAPAPRESAHSESASAVAPKEIPAANDNAAITNADDVSATDETEALAGALRDRL